MENKGINVFVLFVVPCAAAFAAALFAGAWGLMIGITGLVMLAVETLMIRLMSPAVLKRRTSAGHWWDSVLGPIAAVLGVAAAVLSVIDSAVLKVSLLPGWTFFLGIGLLIGSYLLIAQSVRANAPHAADKYGEAAPEKPDHGPYDTIRHPVMLAVALAGLSLPLVIGSGIGFIPAGLMLAAVVTRTALEDDWRFTTYEWFFDYTKQVSFRLLPFIW